MKTADAGRTSTHRTVLALVSLVSVCDRNWFYLCETVETVAECETVEITSIHAVFMHLAENMDTIAKGAR